MGYPPKIPDISDIPYTRGLNALSHRQGISPVSGSPEGTAGTRTLVQSIVCYTHYVKLEQLEATLNNINVFNAGKKREEAVALLAQLLPEVESFQAETQRLRDTIAHERRNASFQREINADLRNELKAERNHSFDQSMKLSELERRYKRAEKLLSKIPQEELDKLLPKQKGLER